LYGLSSDSVGERSSTKCLAGYILFVAIYATGVYPIFVVTLGKIKEEEELKEGKHVKGLWGKVKETFKSEDAEEKDM